MGTSLSIYKKKTQLGMNNLPESLAKLGTQISDSINNSEESKDEPEPESKAEPEPESKAEPEPESKAEPEPESKDEPEPESKAEPEPETFNMVLIPEKSTINKNNQKLLMYDEQHFEKVNETSIAENNQLLDIKEFNEHETFNMVKIPEKSTINKNNQQLLRFDSVDQSNILEISINKNSTLNSSNKNLLLY
jgi:hypothetical protein